MRIAAALLFASAALNLALVATVLLQPSPFPASWRELLPGTAQRQADRAPAPTRMIAAPAAPTAGMWTRLASDDLPTLIARLRAAGFTPALIRAIVSARIETHFADRLRRLAGQVEATPYWQVRGVGLFNNPRLYEERSQIYRERARLLRELLGHDAIAGGSATSTAAQIRQYGDLSPAKIALLERINDDYAEMSSQVRLESNGILLAEDRAKLALLEREKRADLAAVLSAPELEDYEMRSSPITSRLRQAMTLMDASEAEFKTLFRIQQQYGDVLEFQPGMVRMASDYQERQAREKRIADAVVVALGATRAAEYERAQNYEFQRLAQIVQQQSLDLKVAVAAFDLRASTAEESNRIRLDNSLTPGAKVEALRSLGQQTRDKLQAALGPGGKVYADNATWLQAIESGRAVSFNGRSTVYHSISARPPQPNP
jgi:sulfur relay (sulfurtransferase) complex TusBCD TusD component (DsrE family)